MKILHVLDHSLPSQSGYAFRSAAILREQRKRGWQTVQLTGPKHEGPPQNEIRDGIEYLRTPARNSWLGRLPGGDQLDVVRLLRQQVRELVRRERPDVIHAHSPCLNALAALGLGVPLVYEMRSSWEDAAVSTGTTTEGSLRYRLSRGLETFVLRRVDAVVTICEGLRQEVMARGVAAERIAVVPNAVDPDSFTRSSADPQKTREALGLNGHSVLGFIGSFFAWEGLSLLIEALPAILRERPDARVLLVGGGVHEPALRQAVAQRGLQSQVIFAGQVPHSQVPALYDVIDVLVYPRLPMRLTDMVTPLKPLEAMALGKVQIASDVGGHRELIEDQYTGVLFKAGDADALARAALSVLNDPDLARRLRENGPRHVREHRTWARVVANYEPVYRSLCRNRF
ncbi:MAG TPA: TIGR04063 family PEP-CTERM/XrtA system glycosyltransferase [Steroidobacteraceae bacterium]